MMPPRVRRRWWLKYFTDHPGHKSGSKDALANPTSNQNPKIKLICTACLNHRVGQMQTDDREMVAIGDIPAIRSFKEIQALCKCI